MDRFFVHPDVKFKRHADDGMIRPVCQRPIKEGDTVCYEIPVKSTGENFKLDVLRYTMQCVYSGQCLFPCAFNQESPEDDVKVFFDHVFRTTYKRTLSERLALALYYHNKTNPPFLYKALGIFHTSDHVSNCLRVSYENGEAFISATKDIAIGEVLRAAAKPVTVPTKKEEGDFATTLRMMTRFDFTEAHLFTKAVSYRTKADLVRPDARVVIVNSKFDTGLDHRVAKYTMDRNLGVTDFYATLDRIDKKSKEPEFLDLEEMYNKLNEAFQEDSDESTNA